MHPTFQPGPVFRAKHPGTGAKAYFGSVTALGVEGEKKLDVPCKTRAQAAKLAEITAKALNTLPADGQPAATPA